MFSQETKSATIIQKHMRGYLARKKYAIKHLAKDQQTSFQTYVIGNDPVIYGVEKYKSNQKVALIATSGIRAVLIACQLSNPKITPKIILVDNSQQVYQFWCKMRDYAAEHKNEDSFLTHLNEFLIQNRKLYVRLPPYHTPQIPGAEYINQDINAFFKRLFNEFGYEYVRSTIQQTSFIIQTWTDPTLFPKIKNILKYNHFDQAYVYASNIFMYCDEDIRDQVLHNIDSLDPSFSIHTDLSQTYRLPRKSFFFTHEAPQEIKETLLASSQDERKRERESSCILL